MSENPILDELTYDPSSGSLLFNGVRYLLIRPETIAGFQQAMNASFGKESDRHIFEGGFKGGYLSAKKYKERYDFSDLEIVEFMMKMGTQIGWGRFSLEQYDSKKKILDVSVSHSPFADSYGPSTGGVCHLIRGVLAGLATILFGKKCRSREIECRAKGNQICRFVVEGR